MDLGFGIFVKQDSIEMEPNHWSNLNPQYAARLSAGGVPANPGPLPFLDQHTLAAGGKYYTISVCVCVCVL